MKNKKRFVPWLIAAVIIAAFAVIGKKLYDLMFGGSLAVTTEDLKNGIIACSPAIIFIVVVLIAALIVVVAAGKLKQPKRALVRAQAPIAILLAITLSVNWVILGVEYSVVNSVFAEDVKVSDETMASGRAIADQIASEGIVLLKNDDKALPLSAGTKLNLFGWSSVRPLYGGTGSGDSDTSNAVSLIDGLKHAGFEVNEELVKFYENFRTERPVGTIRLREIGSKRGDFTVPEPTIAEYENANIFEDGLDLDGRAVHLFLRFQLDLIRADSIGKIKTSAGGLGRCLPAGVVFLHNRFRLRFLLTDLRSDQGNGLPPCATGIVDVGVVPTGGGVGFHTVRQLIGRGKINFRRGAFGKVFDNIHLYIVIN